MANTKRLRPGGKGKSWPGVKKSLTPQNFGADQVGHAAKRELPTTSNAWMKRVYACIYECLVETTHSVVCNASSLV